MSVSAGIIYAFFYSQNIYKGIQNLGWKIFLGKFWLYLRNKYNVIKAFYFIGDRMGYKWLYNDLQNNGYIVIKKPTVILPNGTVKGNVDADLVLHSMIEYSNYDKAIIVAGDGDYYCLVEYLVNNNKFLHLIAPSIDYSQLFRPYSSYIIKIDQLRNSLEYNKKTGISGRSKP